MGSSGLTAPVRTTRLLDEELVVGRQRAEPVQAGVGRPLGGRVRVRRHAQHVRRARAAHCPACCPPHGAHLGTFSRAAASLAGCIAQCASIGACLCCAGPGAPTHVFICCASRGTVIKAAARTAACCSSSCAAHVRAGPTVGRVAGTSAAGAASPISGRGRWRIAAAAAGHRRRRRRKGQQERALPHGTHVPVAAGRAAPFRQLALEFPPWCTHSASGLRCAMPLSPDGPNCGSSRRGTLHSHMTVMSRSPQGALRPSYSLPSLSNPAAHTHG